jgi:glutathionyl-hydroquinone reductase
MNSAFDRVGASPGDFYPVELREQIDALNARIYTTVNNGVYKAGFATHRYRHPTGIGRVRPNIDLVEAISPGDRVGNDDRTFLEGPAVLSMNQCTTDSEIAVSSPFRARKIKVRCAQGQASET